MQPATPEKLLEAFKILDPEGKGYVSKEYLSKLMMEEGEPFSQVLNLNMTRKLNMFSE
jgi:Ca2+-binding EF-hand superfamily protein